MTTVTEAIAAHTCIERLLPHVERIQFGAVRMGLSAAFG